MEHPPTDATQTAVGDEVGIMDRLRVATAHQHEVAENHPYQQAFFAGRLPRDSYARYLAELHHIYGGLESRILETAKATPALSAVVSEENYRAGDLKDDLDFFGVAPNDFAPTASTERLMSDIDELMARSHLALLGLHYVLEGSNNGSKFIARNIRRAYDLEDRGVRTLDPYGSDQRQRWLEYKTRMGGVKLTPEEADIIVEAAKLMFDSLGRVSSDLMPEKLQDAVS